MTDLDGWQEVYRSVFHPWHEDHFDHVNVRHYAPVFDDAVYHMWTVLGLPYSEMISEYGVHCVTAQATTKFQKETIAGDLVVVYGSIARLGTKSITLALKMVHADTREVHATYEIVEVVFNPDARASAEMPKRMRKQLESCLLLTS